MRKMRMRPVTVLRSTLTPVYRLVKVVMRLRYRIVTALAPRVAAADSANCEPESLEKSMLFERFDPILTTRRGIPARGRKIGRYGDLVKSDECDSDLRQHWNPHSA